MFLIENYLKKGMDISDIKLNTIAKDNLSRYPLYSFLKFYNLERLMPKKYANNIALSESDLFINYCINYKYTSIPENMTFVEYRLVNDYKYYIYKFETEFNYDEEIQDVATDYILKNTEIDKTIKENNKVTYIGISGGFNKDIDPSLIELNLSELAVKKYIGDFNTIVEELLPKKEKPIAIDVLKEKIEKVNSDKDKPKEKKEFFLFKKKDKTQKIKKEKVKKPKIEEKIEEFDEEKEPSLLRRIFSFNTLLILICLCFGGCVFVLITYLKGMDILDMKNTSNDYTNLKVIKSIPLSDDRITEINYDAIWNQEQGEYYVLLYNKKGKSVYHGYLKTLLNNDYKIYYVNTNKEENKAIFGPNPTGFIIEKDTWLKVNDKEYEFYVVGKTNILKELREYIDVINKRVEEEEKKKQEDEKVNKSTEDIDKKINKLFNSKRDAKKLAMVTCKKKVVKKIDFYSKKVYNLNIDFEKEE